MNRFDSYRVRAFRLSGVRLELALAFSIKIAGAAVAFLLNWFIARHYGAAGAGLVAAAVTTTVMVASFAVLGLDNVLVRAVAIHQRQGSLDRSKAAVKRVFVLVGALALIFALGVLLARNLLSTIVADSHEAGPYFALAAIAVPALALARIASAALRGLGRVPLSQLIIGPVGASAAIVALALTVFAGGARTALWATAYQSLGWVLAAGIGCYALVRMLKPVGRSPVPEPMLKSGLLLFAAGMSTYFLEWLAVFTVSAHYGPAGAGIFRISFQIAGLFTLINLAFQSIMGPHFAADLHERNFGRVATLARKSSLAMGAAAFPLLFLVMIWPELVLSLFGAEFLVGAWTLRILAAGQFLNLLLGPVGLIIIMARHEKLNLAYNLGSNVFAAVLCVLLTPVWGPEGAAIALAATALVRRIAAAIIVRRVIGVRLIGRSGRQDASERAASEGSAAC